MERLWMDLRFSLRTLRKNPGFTGIAILVLALGCGATTAVFSVVNAVLLRPLPYDDPSRLVAVSSVYQQGSVTRSSPVVPLSDVKEWRQESRTVQSMGAFAYTELPIRVGEQAYYPVTALMDPEFLPTLGDTLAMGTPFTRDAASDHTMIITHKLWLDAFNGDPGVVGRPVIVDGEAVTVRGVLKDTFQFPRSDASYFTAPIDMLLPAALVPGFPAANRQWFGIARLRSGVTLNQAQAELATIAAGVSERTNQNKGWTVRLTPLAEETARNSRAALLISLGISVLLLVVASTNLMNLFFSRGASRLQEMTIRKAIGGTTGRLVRQMLTEGLCLAVLGGTGGVLIAWKAIDALIALSPVHLPVTQKIGIDGTVLLFTFVTCAAAVLIAALVPALHVGLRPAADVRAGMRSTPGRTLGRIQSALCVAQIALGVGLLAAAGLLTHSLVRLSSVDPGFRSESTMGFNLSVPSDHSMEQRKRFYADALAEVRSIPGVTSAGWTTFLPPETRAGVFMGISIDGVPAPAAGESPRLANTLVSGEGYFPTVGMTMFRGRDFRAGDTADSPPVIIVNEAFARKYFPNQDALGQRIGTGFDGGRPLREIIGIVRDAKDRGLDRAAYPTVYLPLTQFALPYGSIAFRTQRGPESVIPEIRRRLARLDPAIPLTGFQTLEERLHQSLQEPRFYTSMAAACACMAVLFVTLGLYGIVALSVSQRTREFGIRMAVGALQPEILRLVLLQGVRLAAIGVLLGLGLSLVLSRFLTSLLFEVKPVDPPTLVLAAGLTLLVTLFASYVPARRASRVNPLEALRYE